MAHQAAGRTRAYRDVRALREGGGELNDIKESFSVKFSDGSEGVPMVTGNFRTWEPSKPLSHLERLQWTIRRAIGSRLRGVADWLDEEY